MKPFEKALITGVICFFTGAFIIGMFAKKQTSGLLKYHNFLESENKDYRIIVKHLRNQQKWFTSGYIEVYSPGRYLFNGSPAGRKPFVASHPNLPIGTILYVKNLENQTFTVVPILDRKYVVASRVILSITDEVAEELDWHPTDRFYIGIVGVPPSYDEDFWNDERMEEIKAMNNTKRYRRKRLW